MTCGYVTETLKGESTWTQMTTPKTGDVTDNQQLS